MPILGIMASQISGHLFAPSGAYDALATVTLSSAVRPVTFSGIPSGYKHLQVRIFTQQSTSQYSTLSFNGNTSSSSYRGHYLTGNGSAASAGAWGQTFPGIVISGAVSGMGSGSYWSATIIDILDYSNVNKNKTTRTLMGIDLNGSGSVELSSGLYISTDAITSISFTSPDYDYSVGSSFALYGVK